MRLLFSCMPWEGHFRPLLPLAQALGRRGHQIAFASASEWEPRAREEGFDLLAAGLSQEEGRARFAPDREWIFQLPPAERRPLQFSRLFAKVHAPVKVPDLVEVTREWGADAIVFDSCDLAGPAAAAALDLPSVNHSFGAMIPLRALEAAMEYLEPLWRGHGLEPEALGGAFRGLFVDLAPPTFAWEQPSGETIRLRPVPDAAGDAPSWLDEFERPLVYVTMGTVYNEPQLFRPLLDGLDGSAAALVTVGRDVDPAALAPLPERVRVEGFVPQAHILPRCDAVISHGGSGTTLGALAHGLPLLLVPQAADQFDNAARAEAAGAALVLRPGEVTAEAVGGGLRRILDESSFRAAAGRIADEIRAMPDADEAASAVEEFVARGLGDRVSARARTSVLVAALAVGAAVAVAGAAVLSADEAEPQTAATTQPKPRPGAPPLDLSFGVRDDAEARDLRRASELYAAGRRGAAKRIFGSYDSLEAKLGAAFADWPASENRIEQLGALYPRSALVQLHVGLARLWAGVGGAASAWREARDVEPDTPYAVRAGDFLHRDFAPGLPLFTPSFAQQIEGDTAAEQLQWLREASQASFDSDLDLDYDLLYGVALQRLGRPVSARRVFAGAARRHPEAVEALVADAVGRYDKSDPTAAFSRLGPLTRRFPRAATVRFHLGVLLLWQADVAEAKRQLRLARQAEPGSRIAREAGRYLNEIGKIGTG